jgi:pimeloyl-ACP methyl ester carboxylesterase
METRTGQVVVHYVQHGTGRPVLVLHGAGVDHREAEACLEPVLEGVAGLRRIYPDLAGMGRTIAPGTLCSADDILDTLLDVADPVSGGTAHLLIGHSAGGYYAQAMAARRRPRSPAWRSSVRCCQGSATFQNTVSSPDRV